MSVRILYDPGLGEAALYDSVTGHAFGPVFTDDELEADREAEAFLEWLSSSGLEAGLELELRPLVGSGDDARQWSGANLERLVMHWRDTVKVSA